MERLKRKEGDRELVEEEERRRDQVLRSVTAGECVGETVLVHVVLGTWCSARPYICSFLL